MYLIFLGIITIATSIWAIWYSENKKKQLRLQQLKEIEERRLQRERETEQHITAIKQHRLDQIELFRQTVFSIVPNDKNIESVWNFWSHEIHDTELQLYEQILSLYEVPLILLHRDSVAPYAYFADGYFKVCYTDLLSCTCDKFKETQKPCKHIYRLFHEITNENQDSEFINPSPTIENMFLKLSDSCKEHFVQSLNMGKYGLNCFLNDYIKEEINVGLLKASNDVDYTPVLSKMTKDQMILSLSKEGIAGFRQSWSKVALIAWVIENQKDFCKNKFANYVHIEFAEEVFEWKESIAQSRKAITFSHPRSVEEMLSANDNH